MKRPQPDLKDVLIPRYIDKLAFVRKFIKYWGVTTVDGVKVLTPKKYYYKHMNTSTVKLAKFLGIYSDLKGARMKGVKSAWLYLNHHKSSKFDFDKTILAQNMDLAIGTGRQIRLLLGPKIGKASSNRYVSKAITAVPISTPVIDQVGVIQEILNEYATYWQDGYLVSSTESYDKYVEILAKYILFSNDVPFTISKVNKTYTSVSVPYSTYDWYSDDNITAYETVKVDAYEVVIDIPQFNFSETTDIVVKVCNDATYGASNYGKAIDNIKFLLTAITKNSGSYWDDSDEEETVTYYEFVFNDNVALWHTPSSQSIYGDTIKYLKEDALTGSLLTLDQKIELINSIIDSDYQEKSRDFWETLVVFVIIIVAVYFQQYQFAAAAAKYGTVVAIAMVVSTTALVLSIAAALASAMGVTGVAMAINKFLKDVAPLIAIASIVSLYSFVRNLAKKGMEETAKKAGTELAKNATVNVTMENVMAGVQAQITDLFSSSLTDVSLEQATKITNMAFDAYQKQDLADLQKKIVREESKLAQLAEAKEGSQTRNLMMDMMRIQFNSLGRDYSYYDRMFDRPYERWATEYHTGNICATTVNALWTKDT